MPVVGPPIPSVGGVGTTVEDLVQHTRSHLYAAGRQYLNVLADAILNDTDVEFGLTLDLNEATRGSILSIDNELMYVVSALPAPKTVTVIRGYMGTAAVTHSPGTVVEVNARFPKAMIKRALQQEIDSWGSRLYRVVPVTIELGNESRAYDLGVSNYLYVVDARLSPYTGRTTRSQPSHWTIVRNASADDFPSGNAVQLMGSYPVPGSIRLTLAQEFDVSVWEDDSVVEDMGLSSSMLDIPPIGAAWRLMSAREVSRTNMQAQPEPRRSEEVPAGHMASVASQLKKLRDDRIEEERWTLMQRYSYKGVA